MKILARQEFGLTFFQPLRWGQRLALGAMPIGARIICIPFVGTLVTSFQMTAELPRCDIVRWSAAPASASGTEKQHAPGETHRRGHARYRRLPGRAAWRSDLGLWIHDG